ncbi:MAG: RsiV family protein [Muribaculaceae bacterium]
MKYLLSVAALLIFLCIIPSGCSHSRNSSRSDAGDTVVFHNVTVSDSVMFLISGRDSACVKVCLSLALPSEYPDSAALSMFNNQLSAYLLGPDTLSTASESFASTYIASVLDVFNGSNWAEVHDSLPGYHDEMPSDFTDVVMSIDVYPVFNSNGIVSMCKHRTTIYGEPDTLSERFYFNYNLRNMSVIDITSLISEDDFVEVSEMLRYRLLDDSGVRTNDELIELGYFNLDNLQVNNNFSISHNGITWNYIPFEIACYKIGETAITLSFDELAPYLLIKDFVK